MKIITTTSVQFPDKMVPPGTTLDVSAKEAAHLVERNAAEIVEEEPPAQRPARTKAAPEEA